MTPTSRRALARALLDRWGTTFAEELGLRLSHNRPSDLFRLLVYALLASAPISASLALRGARALTEAGFSTPERMAATTWRARTRVLNRSGYARYDERTSTMLADTCALLLERYGGDLRKLRSAAGFDPARERELLQEFSGIGEVGADIFLREAQVAWDELAPYADARALHAAERLGLGHDARTLARLVAPIEFARFVAALVRCDRARAWDELRQAA